MAMSGLFVRTLLSGLEVLSAGVSFHLGVLGGSATLLAALHPCLRPQQAVYPPRTRCDLLSLFNEVFSEVEEALAIRRKEEQSRAHRYATAHVLGRADSSGFSCSYVFYILWL